MRNYGEALRKLRLRANMTQQDLAAKLNISAQAVSKWEKGINRIDISTMQDICALFGVTVEEFLRIADGGSLDMDATVSVQEETVPASPSPVKRQKAPVYWLLAALLLALAVLALTAGIVLLHVPAGGGGGKAAVTFRGGDSVLTVTAEQGEVLSLEEYTLEGYEVLGWYEDEALTKPVNRVRAKEGLTLYAEVRPHVYRIRFLGEGAEQEEQWAVYGEECPLPGCTLVPPSGKQVFDVWKSEDGKTYGAGETVKNLTAEDEGEVLLIAQWREKRFYIDFDPDGKGEAIPSREYSFSDEVRFRDLPEPACTAKGYGFEGWTVSGPNGPCAEPPAYLETLAEQDGCRIHLKAVWYAFTYYVDYYWTEDSNSPCYRQTMTYDTSAFLRAYTSFEEYTYACPGIFRHWRWGDKTYPDGALVRNLTDEEGAAVKLYGVWEEAFYQIVFDGNGGTGSMEPMQMQYGVEAKLPNCGFVRDGYLFTGWECGGRIYEAGAAVSDLAMEGTVTMTAQWAKAFPGRGTSESPYLLSNAGDLAYFRTFISQYPYGMSAKYALTADIDFGGGSWEPIWQFEGGFDGRGHCFRNLTFRSSYAATGGEGYGVFNNLNGASIQNFGVVNYSLSLQAGRQTQNIWVGPVAVNCDENCTVEGCYTDGKVTCRLTPYAHDGMGRMVGIGGVVANVDSTSGRPGAGTTYIRNCHAKGSVEVEVEAVPSSDPVLPNVYLGGIVSVDSFVTSVNNAASMISACISELSFTLKGTFGSNNVYVGGVSGYANKTHHSGNLFLGHIDASGTEWTSFSPFPFRYGALYNTAAAVDGWMISLKKNYYAEDYLVPISAGKPHQSDRCVQEQRENLQSLSYVNDTLHLDLKETYWKQTEDGIALAAFSV